MVSVKTVWRVIFISLWFFQLNKKFLGMFKEFCFLCLLFIEIQSLAGAEAQKTLHHICFKNRERVRYACSCKTQLFSQRYLKTCSWYCIFGNFSTNTEICCLPSVKSYSMEIEEKTEDCKDRKTGRFLVKHL